MCEAGTVNGAPGTRSADEIRERIHCAAEFRRAQAGHVRRRVDAAAAPRRSGLDRQAGIAGRRVRDARGPRSRVARRGAWGVHADVRRRHQGARRRRGVRLRRPGPCAGLPDTGAATHRRGVLPSAPRCPAVDRRRQPRHRGSHRRVRRAVAVESAIQPPIPDERRLRFTQRPRPLVVFDFWQEMDQTSPAPGSRRWPEPVLRNVRWQQDRFEEGFTFTPIGLALRAQGTRPASGDRYLPVDGGAAVSLRASV